MPSRRDQLQSHQFLTQRVISAFVMRETDPAQSPLRRGIGALFAGLMVAVMVAAGFGVYGLLTKIGGNSWRTDGAVVIEKDTGAAYVYQGGQLHPMLNYASALLATGTPGHPVFRESAAALRGVPRSIMRGIPYAPDSIPAAGSLAGGPWTLCSQVPDGSARPVTTLALATTPSGTHAVADNGLLVRDPVTDSTYLIWHGYRFGLADSLLSGLFGVVTPVPAGTAWLNGIPRGPDIAPLAIPGLGTRSPAAPKYDVGQLLSSPVGSGGVQYWMVFSDGLAPITELQKDIAVSQGAGKLAAVSVPDTNAIPRSKRLRRDDPIALPPKPPALEPLGAVSEQICASFTGAGTAPAVTLGGAILAGTPTRSRTLTGAVLADQILVPAGHAELIRVATGPSAVSGGYFLITDLGIRYAIATDDVLAMLGLTPALAMTVPDSLVRLIPDGPALDPADAAAPATG
jgi:type VII secretion protein EccB